MQDGATLDSTILLLTHTSKAIGLFKDKRPISTTTDTRMVELAQFLKFLQRWKLDAGENATKLFFSSKLWFDLQSMIVGFESLIAVKLSAFPKTFIKPAIVNQDVVENHFCQVRACNGQNNNPSFHLQESAQNSIQYGQTTISRKSNAGYSGAKKHSN